MTASTLDSMPPESPAPLFASCVDALDSLHVAESDAPVAMWLATSGALRGAIAIDDSANTELTATRTALGNVARAERPALLHQWHTMAMRGALDNVATTADLMRLARLHAVAGVLATNVGD